MIDINKQELTKKLVDIYQRYVEGEDSENLRREAFQIYKIYSGASLFLDKKISIALNKLIDLYEDTGVTVSKEEAKKILEDLKNVKP